MGGLGVKVQHFPLTLLVVLTTLTLPCERDIVCYEFMPSLTYCHDAHFDESNRSRIEVESQL